MGATYAPSVSCKLNENCTNSPYRISVSISMITISDVSFILCLGQQHTQSLDLTPVSPHQVTLHPR